MNNNVLVIFSLFYDSPHMSNFKELYLKSSSTTVGNKSYFKGMQKLSYQLGNVERFEPTTIIAFKGLQTLKIKFPSIRIGELYELIEVIEQSDLPLKTLQISISSTPGLVFASQVFIETLQVELNKFSPRVMVVYDPIDKRIIGNCSNIFSSERLT